MDSLDQFENKRIIYGRFPSSRIYPSEYIFSEESRFEDYIKRGSEVLRNDLVNSFVLFLYATNEINESSQIPEGGCEVNVLVNTGYDPQTLVLPTRIEISNMYPCITFFDRVIYLLVQSYELKLRLEVGNKQENKDQMYAWAYLLRTIQKKEYKYGKCICVEKIIQAGVFGQLLFDDWDDIPNIYFKKLSLEEKQLLSDLMIKREKLVKRILYEMQEAKEVANKTYHNWQSFIELVNDISQKENDVICKINASSTQKEKISVINQYVNIIKEIEKGRYSLNGKQIYLLGVLDGVHERMQKSFCYCKVEDEDSESSFEISPNLLGLFIEPKTFNYLYMTFHLFCLKPNKENAYQFLTSALVSINRNLGNEEYHIPVNIEGIVLSFQKTIDEYIVNNSIDLMCSRYNNIQEDEISDSVITSNIRISDRILGVTHDFLKNMQEKPFDYSSVREIKELLGFKIQEHSKQEQAHRLVISLNIIYMVCEAIRIILTNKHANIKVKNEENMIAVRRKLLKLDQKIICVAYSDLDETEIGMIEYREQKGFIRNSLRERELEEEKLRNSVIENVVKRNIFKLIEQIDGKNIDEIIVLRSQIREEIYNCTECEDKEKYAEWLDQVSDTLCSKLVKQCERNIDEYSSERDNIITFLGEKGKTLPENVISSLTTAELLYNKYAKASYAESGFDYSSISALYYQAFEVAYNTLVWNKYVSFLNHLNVENESYLDYLNNLGSKRIKESMFKGYLPSSFEDRKFYTEYSKESGVIIKENLMYGSFSRIIDKVVPDSEIHYFSDFVAKLAGYEDKDEMFSNIKFVKLLNRFKKDIRESVDFRNNASHGGSKICITQCAKDKKLVLYDIESIRDRNIGILMQLLDILSGIE